jgi:hypothetical protein
MSKSAATHGHATAVADILAGYHRIEMAAYRDDRSTKEHKLRQDGRTREEERFARQADQPAEQRAHQRRADKAAYLRDKLAEAEEADRAAGIDPERPKN